MPPPFWGPGLQPRHMPWFAGQHSVHWSTTAREEIWSFFKKRFYLLIFRQRGREEEREGNIYVWLPLMHPLLGTWPTTQACALTGNWTLDPLVCRLALNLLSHTSQGDHVVFILLFVYVVYYIYWFVNVVLTLHSWNKCHLITMCDLFEVWLYWVLVLGASLGC